METATGRQRFAPLDPPIVPRPAFCPGCGGPVWLADSLRWELTDQAGRSWHQPCAAEALTAVPAKVSAK